MSQRSSLHHDDIKQGPRRGDVQGIGGSKGRRGDEPCAPAAGAGAAEGHRCRGQPRPRLDKQFAGKPLPSTTKSTQTKTMSGLLSHFSRAPFTTAKRFVPTSLRALRVTVLGSCAYMPTQGHSARHDSVWRPRKHFARYCGSRVLPMCNTLHPHPLVQPAKSASPRQRFRMGTHHAPLHDTQRAERILTRRITLRTETGSSAASQGLLPERGGESTSKNGGASVGEHLHGAGDAEQPTGRPREVRGDASGGALSVPLGAYSLPSVLNNTTTFCAQRAPFKPPLHPSVGVQNLL